MRVCYLWSMTNTAVLDEALQPKVFDSENLGQLMKLRRISVTELGVRCDRAAFTIKAYLENRADPPAGIVGLMAFALEVPIEALFRPALPDEVEMTTLVAPRHRRIRKS
jgi:hypothetical protein